MTIEDMIIRSVMKRMWLSPEYVTANIASIFNKHYKVATIERAGRRLVGKGKLERGMFDTIDGKTQFVKWRKGKK